MVDLIVSQDVADELAVGLQAVDLSGTGTAPLIGPMNVPGALHGISLCNNLQSDFASLSALIAKRATSLTRIAEIFIEADRQLARILP